MMFVHFFQPVFIQRQRHSIAVSATLRVYLFLTRALHSDSITLLILTTMIQCGFTIRVMHNFLYKVMHELISSLIVDSIV